MVWVGYLIQVQELRFQGAEAEHFTCLVCQDQLEGYPQALGQEPCQEYPGNGSFVLLRKGSEYGAYGFHALLAWAWLK